MKKSPICNKNILLEGHKPLNSAQKSTFKYFGNNAKIKPPYRILNPQNIYIGDYTSIQEYCHINAFIDLTFLMDYIDKKYRADFDAHDYIYDSHIHIDRECQIGRFLFISCTKSIVIQKNVLISERAFIGDNNHSFSHPCVPIIQQPNKQGIPIEIGQGSWIGTGASILKGTVLGNYSVVSTNSVVEGVFPSHSVIGYDKARLLFRYFDE